MEMKMAALESNTPKPNSGTGWTLPLPAWFGTQPAPGLHLNEQAARTSLMMLEMTESYLAASRQMIDLWRMSVRQFQGGMLSTYRYQVLDKFAHEAGDESSLAAAEAARPQPLGKRSTVKTTSTEAA
jgi:hypothetical protein